MRHDFEYFGIFADYMYHMDKKKPLSYWDRVRFSHVKNKIDDICKERSIPFQIWVQSTMFDLLEQTGLIKKEEDKNDVQFEGNRSETERNSPSTR